MIRIQVRSIHQHAVRTFIQIWNLLREPRHVLHLWRKKQQSNIEYLYSNSKSHICLLLSFIHVPLSSGRRLSGASISSTFTCFLSSWMSSWSCSRLLSQSTKISNSELRLLDFLDSMCTRLTWFSWWFIYDG